MVMNDYGVPHDPRTQKSTEILESYGISNPKASELARISYLSEWDRDSIPDAIEEIKEERQQYRIDHDPRTEKSMILLSDQGIDDPTPDELERTSYQSEWDQSDLADSISRYKDDRAAERRSQRLQNMKDRVAGKLFKNPLKSGRGKIRY